MSDARAVEAVTETLRKLVDAGAKSVESGAVAVVLPPNEVKPADHDLQINLFLYQMEIDGALRNTDPIGLVPGETGRPPLPLILHYLLTPYARGEDVRAHRVLGGALQALHSHSVLTRSDLASDAPFSDVSTQIEQVRIAWQPFDEKDIYSLWSVFQAPYRLSVAFEVRVVLIDSLRRPIAPLPVLTRGADGRGPTVVPDVASPLPAVTGVELPAGQAAAEVGDVVVVRGAHLSAATAVRIGHRSLTTPIDVAPPTQVGSGAVTFTLPNTIPAGLCTVSVVLGPQDPLVAGVQLAVAPKITSPMPMNVARDAAGTATIALTCDPPIVPGQKVVLLLGGRSVAADTIANPTPNVTFEVTHAEGKKHLVRLRIDGVDSLVIDHSVTPPQFDANQSVTVT